MQEINKIKCPDCSNLIQKQNIKEHVISCKSYSRNILNNTMKLIDHLSPSYLQFVIAELQIAKQHLQTVNGAMQNGIPVSEVSEVQKIDNTIPIDEPLIEEIFKRRPSRQELPSSQDHKIQPKKQMVICMNCEREIDANNVSQFTYTFLCFHLLCKNCLVSYIDDQYVAKKGNLKCLAKGCKDQIPTEQIKQIMGAVVFEKLEHELLRETMNITVCCRCKQEFQFQEGNSRDAPKTDPNGKKVKEKHLEQYAKNRFVCPNSACKMQQCRVCKAIPYHFGMTCAQYFDFQTSKKCRYCKDPLPKGYTSNLGIKSFDDICKKKDCEKLSKKACSKIHKCNHPCLGYIREKNCLPCLHENCTARIVKHDQNEDSYCSICFVEDLKAKPCVQSACGHIFHYQCLQKRLEIRWLTPRILFGFCECPLCKQWIQVPKDCPLSEKLENYKTLYQMIREKAEKRMKYEQLHKDKKILDPTSSYHNKPLLYALAIYAYFECYKCKKPYFGGRKNCAEVMNVEGSRENQEYDPKKLICPECCPIPVKNCEKHGKQYLAFKCKFCCNIAQWFCWGNTHFCDSCHKKQLEGHYVSKMKKEDLPKCQGPGKCPSGGEHGGNGEEFSLGCFICRNYKAENKDF